MDTYSKETISYRKIVGSPHILRDGEFEQCHFEGGSLVQYDDPDCGLVVADVTLRKCRVGNCVVHGVRFEDVVVDGLTNRAMIYLESCLFERVTLRGRIGPIMTLPASNTIPESTQVEFREEAAKYFAGLDWALDISEAQFNDADFSQVPGHLVRRDPETQFLVHKQAALTAEVDTLPGFAAIAVERATKSPYDTIIAVAPTRSKSFQQYRDELQILRDRGIAE